MGKKEAVVGALKTAGAKAAPIVSGAAGKVAGAAGATGTAVKGVALGAGAAAGSGAVRSFKNRGFFLFIAATIVFIISQISGIPAIYGYISLFFMLFSSLVVFERKGAFIVIIFTIWYFIYGAPNITAIKYHIIPIIIFGALFHGLVSKFSGKESFSRGAGNEAIIGLGHIFVFFIDVGITDWVTQEFGVSMPYIIERLIILIPLWAYVGLYVMMKDETEKTAITTVSTIAGILYLVGVLILISGEAQAGERLLPGMEELVKAKQEAMKENTFIAELACTFEIMSKPGLGINREECLKEREMKYTCEEVRGFKEGTKDWNECMDEEKKKREKGLRIGGIDDPTLKPITAEFKISKYFPKLILQHRWPFTAQLVIKIPNEREQNLDITFHCFFNDTRGKRGVPGTIDIPHTGDISTNKNINVLCTPEEDLEEGTYTLTYQADIHNIKTTSHLDLLFVSEITEKTEEETKERESRYLEGKHFSQGPKDFARINFGLGESTLIKKGDKPYFGSEIENIRRGKILAVKKYYNDLEERGITPADEECFRGENIALPKTKIRSPIPLKPCRVNLPPQLTEFEEEDDFKRVKVTMAMEYDYQIEKKIKEIKVKPPELVS